MTRLVKFGMLVLILSGAVFVGRIGPLLAQTSPMIELLDRCPYATPRGFQTDCGYLSVPEDRSDPNSRLIRVAFARVHSASDTPAPDPLIHLVGGPGGTTLPRLTLPFFDAFRPYLETRDVIFVDQRGTGFSIPRLHCTEIDNNLISWLSVYDDPEAPNPRIPLLAACHDRLKAAGINTAAYNSAENAADIVDLWKTLGYEQVNLHGVSYGTRLALTIMRDHPEGIRSVVLDSVVPLQGNLYSDIFDHIDRAHAVLFAGCAADSACNAAYPNLETAFWEVMDGLDSAPVVIETTVPGFGPARIALTGERFFDWVFNWMYAVPDIVNIPRFIYAVRDQNFQEAFRSGMGGESSVVFLDMGMHYSVQCSEEIRFNTVDDFTAAAEKYPRFADYIHRMTESSADIFAICDAWSLPSLNPLENEPVVSDIPTIVMSGEYDPITPPTWALQAAETLSQHYYYEVKGVGHGAGRSSECANSIAVAFVNDPTREPDSSCLENLSGPPFVVNP